MASKKDFTSVNTGRVYGAIEQATSRKGQQTKASAQEVHERKSQMRTQGRKGVKADRINMAFSEENYQFIRVMAKATGHTMTQFTNMVVTAYRNEHPEFMEKAQSFIDFVNSGVFSSIGNKDEEADE